MGMLQIRETEVVTAATFSIVRHVLRHVDPETNQPEGKKICLFDLYDKVSDKYIDTFTSFEEAARYARQYHFFKEQAAEALKGDFKL